MAQQGFAPSIFFPPRGQALSCVTLESTSFPLSTHSTLPKPRFPLPGGAGTAAAEARSAPGNLGPWRAIFRRAVSCRGVLRPFDRVPFVSRPLGDLRSDSPTRAPPQRSGEETSHLPGVSAQRLGRNRLKTQEQNNLGEKGKAVVTSPRGNKDENLVKSCSSHQQVIEGGPQFPNQIGSSSSAKVAP